MESLWAKRFNTFTGLNNPDRWRFKCRILYKATFNLCCWWLTLFFVCVNYIETNGNITRVFYALLILFFTACTFLAIFSSILIQKTFPPSMVVILATKTTPYRTLKKGATIYTNLSAQLQTSSQYCVKLLGFIRISTGRLNTIQFLIIYLQGLAP